MISTIFSVIFNGDESGYLNYFLLKFKFISEPIQWLTSEDYLLPIMIIVALWSSMGVGFLAILSGIMNVNEELYEAAYIDGIKNRFQELIYITIPEMRPQMMFGAVMQITSSFGVAGIADALVGFPSVDYAGHFILNHLNDYGGLRYEMGYASAIATVLFLIMILCNKAIQNLLRRVGT